MYSRFRAFLFLTALIFGVVGLIAILQDQNSSKSSVETPGLASLQTEKTQNISQAQKADIPDNWRDDLGVPVLCYHQIVTDAQYRERPTPYAVTVSQFREQMDWLAQNNFYSILPDELLAYVRGEKKLDFKKGRPIVLTFDDGNDDFVNHAQKIMDAHKYRGVLFIYPTYIMARKKRALDWYEIRETGKAGHAIESHTMWHPMLSTMSDDEQRAQFADSKKLLDQKGGAHVKHLAYPFGIYTNKSPALLKEVGYVSAYTTFYGGNQVGEDPYLLRRYLIVRSDDEDIFAEKTLARALPLRYVNTEPGAFIQDETTLEFRIPRHLNPKGFKVKVFSTTQPYRYEPKTGVIKIDFTPSKKRLSVLEILYKENGIEYRANALLNHRRKAEVSPGAKDKKKRKKKKQKRED